jgi:predicted CopG family antitoxin
MFGDIPVYIKDPFTGEVDMTTVIQKLEKTIPRAFTYGVELVVAGQFDDLAKRDVKAAFLDGAIYVTNEQDSVDDIFDDIVHEISHSVEKTHASIIFSDGEVIAEYLGKKNRLISLLVAAGTLVPPDVADNIEYNKAFDEFLHFELGYEKASNYTSGLFIDSYAAVSISEYFATGFESYYVDRNGADLRKISPVLYEKIEMLTNYVTEGF